jgi:hypothetical protein
MNHFILESSYFTTHLTIMESALEWETYVRKIGGSLYTRIPVDWARTKGIQRNEKIKVSLNGDGSLRIDTNDSH